MKNTSVNSQSGCPFDETNNFLQYGYNISYVYKKTKRLNVLLTVNKY